MKQGAKFRTLGLAAALSLSVTAAALLFSACAGDVTGGASGASDKTEVSMTARPLLDQQAPAKFQTATFAFG